VPPVIDLSVSDPVGPAAGHHPRPSATGGARVPALDGVRAVGLLLIMGFHFGVGWMPAGFVGVDVGGRALPAGLAPGPRNLQRSGPLGAFPRWPAG